MDSLKLAATVLVLLLMAGCSAMVPPKYDTHETYEAEAKQDRIDHREWLDRLFITWRDEIRNPAYESVSKEQWDALELDVYRTCGPWPIRSSNEPAYREYLRCSQALQNQLLVANFGAFETLDAYLERQGGEEPEPERPKYKLKPSPPSQFDHEYEEAKQACDHAGGQWITAIHIDGWDSFQNRMRCLEKLPPAHDCAWLDSLLPYEIHVKYNRRSGVIIEFSRIPWEPTRSMSWSDRCAGNVDKIR